jgi:hypothetical protein
MALRFCQSVHPVPVERRDAEIPSRAHAEIATFEYNFLRCAAVASRFLISGFNAMA